MLAKNFLISHFNIHAVRVLLRDALLPKLLKRLLVAIAIGEEAVCLLKESPVWDRFPDRAGKELTGRSGAFGCL